MGRRSVLPTSRPCRTSASFTNRIAEVKKEARTERLSERTITELAKDLAALKATQREEFDRLAGILRKALT